MSALGFESRTNGLKGHRPLFENPKSDTETTDSQHKHPPELKKLDQNPVLGIRRLKAHLRRAPSPPAWAGSRTGRVFALISDGSEPNAVRLDCQAALSECAEATD